MKNQPNGAPGTGRVPPGPPQRAAFTLLRLLNWDRLGMMRLAANGYGDAARLAIGPKALYFFNHPDYAKHVLVDNAENYHKGLGLQQAKRALGDGLLTSEGELWREQRKIIRPVFQNKRIAQQAGIVADEAASLVARLRAHRGERVDVAHEMTGLTLGVLGRTLLDADLGAYGGVGESFEAVQDQAMFEMVTQSMIPPWLPLPKQLRFRKARRELQGVVDQLVAERKARSYGRDDVVSRLVESTSREADPKVGKQRMRDELVTLLLAGHETTASTLSWALHLVDRHPEVRARLHAEAVEVLGDRLPVYEDLHQLTYTSMVISETLRLFPPVWLLTRKALQADEIGGYAVPAGADVLICPYTMHRHPAFWPAPERFDPDRFDQAAAGGRPPYAYIPFGGGPRFCVGNHLGLLEATFVLAMISRELQLYSVPDHKVVAEPMLSLRVKGGLPMIVQPVPGAATQPATQPAA
jgi:cytochrome P450